MTEFSHMVGKEYLSEVLLPEIDKGREMVTGKAGGVDEDGLPSNASVPVQCDAMVTDDSFVRSFLRNESDKVKVCVER